MLRDLLNNGRRDLRLGVGGRPVHLRCDAPGVDARIESVAESRDRVRARSLLDVQLLQHDLLHGARPLARLRHDLDGVALVALASAAAAASFTCWITGWVVAAVAGAAATGTAAARATGSYEIQRKSSTYVQPTLQVAIGIRSLRCQNQPGRSGRASSTST